MSHNDNAEDTGLDLARLPVSLKMQLLSMLNPTKQNTVTSSTSGNDENKKDNKIASPIGSVEKQGHQDLDPIKFGESLFEKDYLMAEDIFKQLELNAYFVMDHWLDDGNDMKNIHEAIQEIKKMKETGKLKRAALGSGATKYVDEKIRGDFHCWMDFNGKIPNSIYYLLEKMKRIRLVLNRIFDLKLDKDSIQVALYPGEGARYAKHADATPFHSSNRRLTALLYLNHHCNGGSLRLYRSERSMNTPSIYAKHEDKPNHDVADFIDIEPKFNRLIIFPSEYYHEVLPNFEKERLSITLWMYGEHDIHTSFLEYKKSRTKNEEQKKHGTIFVSICSYRDPELQHTIEDLFLKSKFPERIYVGICWQYDHVNDIDICFDKTKYYEKSFAKRIKEIHMKHECAKGPTYARHLIQKYLYNNEDFFLQIDSHMRFAQDWDIMLLESLFEGEKKCNKAIISTYPPGYELPNKVPLNSLPTILCAKGFASTKVTNDFDYKMLRLCGRVMLDGKNPGQGSNGMIKVVPTLFWAAGFHFSRGSLLKEVIYDPETPYLFFGEEIVMNFRYFSYGYRIFAPNYVICYHLWNRDYRSTIFEDLKKQSPTVEILHHEVPNYADALKEKMKKYGVKIFNVPECEKETFNSVHDENKVVEYKMKSCKRVMKQFNMLPKIELNSNLKPFDLGDRYNLKQFEEYIGVNFAGQEISEKATCGNYNSNLLA